MIGDIELIKPIHTKKAVILAPKILEVRTSGNIIKLVITLGGESGTGKTEISREIQRILWESYKIRVKIIHVDDYYKTDYHNRNEIRKETGIIGKEEIDWKKLNKVTRHFKEGRKKLYVQRIHRYIDSIEYSISFGDKIDVIIVEGLYANYLDRKDFAIYLEGSINETYDFRKERGKEDPDTEFRQFVLEKERNCIVQSKRFSDIIIPFKV